MMKQHFCNQGSLSIVIPYIIARDLLGIEQLELIEERYRIMQENYDCDYAAWQEHFGNGMSPFKGYTDTTAVTMPITHTFFAPEINALGKGAIGVDFPIWFNMKDDNKHIMLIAEAPLRSNEWYADCRDAVISSPFGQHDCEHRKKSNGGKTLDLLINALVSQGYGVYLTDVNKYFISNRNVTSDFAAKNTDRYSVILKKEMSFVKPDICVCLGKKAQNMLSQVDFDKAISLPHVSGAARGAIIKRFPSLEIDGATAENIAKIYAQEIIRNV